MLGRCDHPSPLLSLAWTANQVVIDSVCAAPAHFSGRPVSRVVVSQGNNGKTITTDTLVLSTMQIRKGRAGLAKSRNIPGWVLATGWLGLGLPGKRKIRGEREGKGMTPRCRAWPKGAHRRPATAVCLIIAPNQNSCARAGLKREGTIKDEGWLAPSCEWAPSQAHEARERLRRVSRDLDERDGGRGCLGVWVVSCFSLGAWDPKPGVG